MNFSKLYQLDEIQITVQHSEAPVWKISAKSSGVCDQFLWLEIEEKGKVDSQGLFLVQALQNPMTSLHILFPTI